MAAQKRRGVLVTGDYILDHHIYEGQRRHYGDHHSHGVKEIEELGGATLIHYLLEALGGVLELGLALGVTGGGLAGVGGVTGL